VGPQAKIAINAKPTQKQPKRGNDPHYANRVAGIVKPFDRSSAEIFRLWIVQNYQRESLSRTEIPTDSLKVSIYESWTNIDTLFACLNPDFDEMVEPQYRWTPANPPLFW
jgi:hypothetical protein